MAVVVYWSSEDCQRTNGMSFRSVSGSHLLGSSGQTCMVPDDFKL